MGRIGVEAELHAPIGGEGSQSRPLALDRLDRPVDRLLESIDRFRHVDLFRRGVARVDRSLVERADPDAVVGLALEIEAFVEVGDERQVLEAGPSDPQLHHRSPFRHQADAGDSGPLGDLLAPGAGGIDEDSRFDFAGTGLDAPAALELARAPELGIGADDAPAAAHRRQAGIVEGGHLDVGAGAFKPGTVPLAPEARN